LFFQEHLLPVIHYQETAVEVNEGQSVLEALESAKFTIPNSCRAGMCHSCMMQADGDIPAEAQKGLSASQVAQDCFLACCCRPTSDLTVQLRGNVDLCKGKIIAKTMLNTSVLALRIQVDFKWFAGQYLNIWKDDNTSRSYSIASRCDAERVIELHIQFHDKGCVSSWLHNVVKEDELLTLSKPIGDCFYTDDHYNKPIVMAGTGTGLAPLYGILQEAIAQQHKAPIYLYAASGEPSGLYYVNELKALAKQYEYIHYLPTVRRNADAGMIEQDLIDAVKEKHPDLAKHKVFICGAPDVVKKIQRNCFFQGAAISDILVDAFEMAP
jgi:NAD(P)H-flavin reductase